MAGHVTGDIYDYYVENAFFFVTIATVSRERTKISSLHSKLYNLRKIWISKNSCSLFFIIIISCTNCAAIKCFFKRFAIAQIDKPMRNLQLDYHTLFNVACCSHMHICDGVVMQHLIVFRSIALT